MKPLHEQTLSETAQSLDEGEVSSIELTRHALDRIARFDGRDGLNAFLQIDTEGALLAAHEADERRSGGRQRSLLDGIPVAIKDLVDVEGMRTTAGSPVFADRLAERDAPLTHRLRQTGAVIIGKTNMMEFAYGHPNPEIGETANPWNATRTAGGSSGGSAAAIAAGMVWAAIGSDTGGSIRSPAAYCGITGLKPTYGLVSCSGVVPLSWSLDHVGPLTRTAEDAALVTAAISGHDPEDPASADPSRIERTRNDILALRGDRVSCEGVRIGVLPQMFDMAVTPGLAEPAEDAVRMLERLGAQVVELHLPQSKIDRILPVIFCIYSVEAATYHRSATSGQWGRLAAPLRKGLEDGLDVLAVDYVDAQRASREIGRAFDGLYATADVLIWPTQPLVAPPLGTTDAVVQGAADSHATTIEVEIAAAGPANLLGQPGLSIPCGFVEGLPVGLHLQAPRFRDDLVLSVGMAYQRETGAPPLPPLD
jgi:aspartyl-tRNA(Asn)/glutamyl-tRNA(Gln) amidotransferase subunit A